MKRAALQAAAWIVAGGMGLGTAFPAEAQNRETGEAPGVPGGGGGHHGMMREAHAGHKHWSLVVQPLWSQSRNQIYTLAGMEMIKQDSRGWKGGFGMYGGMNLGVTNQSNTFHYGGGIFGKDFTAGPLSLTTGVLVGFGKSADILPAVFPAGVQNFYMFGVAAPRVGLAITPYDRLELGLEATYLFTSNPAIGNGPAVLARVSTISWGGAHGGGAHGGKHGHGH